MNVMCEECKFAIWEANLFADAGVRMMYSEQWDCHCTLHNRFFLEDEIDGKCTDGVYGENNMHAVAHDFYELRKKYTDLLHKCCEENDISPYPSYTEEEEKKNFSTWIKYLKVHDKETFNKLSNAKELQNL